MGDVKRSNGTLFKVYIHIVLIAALLMVLMIPAQALNRKTKSTAPAKKPVVSVWHVQLAPRHPALPTVSIKTGSVNPIDRLLFVYYAANKIPAAAPVEDRVFMRRVSLDLIGLLPGDRELQEFVNDKRPDKRERLVRRLLNDNTRYAEHWLSFWNDMLRNDYVGTGYIDGGRAQITDWIYNALETNKPYNQFVSELVNPSPESAGFVKGIVWRGVVNASQTPEMQAAQNISQVFMGINLKCASCHNSFISSWKLADSYGMAGIFAGKSLEMVRCDKPMGQIAPIKFLYPELGTIDSAAPQDQQRAELAALLTNKADGRLSRVLVNRIWAKLMGRGLVEPTDEMDNKPWNADVLDWLAWDFAQNGYDMRRLMLQIATSNAYQRPAMNLKTERSKDFVFRGPVVKRMTAEQYVDAVSTLTGMWQQPAQALRIVKGEPTFSSNSQAVMQYKSPLMKSGSTDLDFDITGAKVLMLIVTDGGNGESFDWADWGAPRVLGPQGEIKLTDLKWHSATTDYGKIQINKSIVEKPIRLGDKTFENGIGTHANSVITYILPPGVTRFRATAGPDTGATEQPNSVTSIRMFVVTGDLSLLEARASMALADPLMRALDRPNREQVVTERATTATTLQALELTNGQTLSGMLTQGAEKWAQSAKSPEMLVDQIYRRGLGRAPLPAEKQAAIELVGTSAKKEGVEDLLWTLIMLPEFQLIY